MYLRLACTALTRKGVLAKPNRTITSRKKAVNSVVTKEFSEDTDIRFKNEPILEYEEGSEERCRLKEALDKLSGSCEEIPIIIKGKSYQSAFERHQVIPHNYGQKIAKFYHADKNILLKAIKASQNIQKKWDKTTLADRIDVWEKAATLMATKYRAELVAATMLGQSKTVFQAEIDAAAELVDFIRMNCDFLKFLSQYEPISTKASVVKNHMRFRGIGGFVAAITPFNFTAIGGNLAFTPALMGNSVLWKPADSAMLASWVVFKIMREAGLPDGIVNFVPADGPCFGSVITSSPELAGINFTGSYATFKSLWKMVGKNISIYKNFPRLLGECGGKNFHFVHPSASVETAVAATIRSAFEYSGQKCSACSRLYVPESLWQGCLKKAFQEKVCQLKVGDVCDFSTFTSAVINETAFVRIVKEIKKAEENRNYDIVVGGKYSDLKGYYIDPTIIECKDPFDNLFKVEFFGPLLAVFVYKDADIEETVKNVVKTSDYALTGAIFAKDKEFLKYALEAFRMSAGNLYINDKSTGAVVGQQPFGGSRWSGTNDKPGGPFYLLRWTTPQAIKETFVEQDEILYPYMGSPNMENDLLVTKVKGVK